MNRLRQHLGNPYFAVHPKDKLFVCYFIGFGVFSLCYTIFVVLPYNYSEVSHLHHLLLTFLYLSIYLNFYKMIANSSHLTIGRMANDGETPKEVTIDGDFDRFKEVIGDEEGFCNVCRVSKPVRSFHCKRCNVCVKKRDHHCVLNGSCVGFANQRFYFSMAFYVAVASTYFSFHNVPLVYQQIVKHNIITVPFCFIAPHFLFFFGIITFFEFFVCLVTLKTSAVLLFSYAVTLHQFLLMIRGQTRHEMKVKVNRFSKGAVDNLRSALGKNWYLAWACPLVPSPLPNDEDLIFQEYSKLV